LVNPDLRQHKDRILVISAADDIRQFLQGKTQPQELVSLAGNRTAQCTRDSQQRTSLKAQLKKKPPFSSIMDNTVGTESTRTGASAGLLSDAHFRHQFSD